MAKLLTARLKQCYTGILYDIMRDMGLKNFNLPPEIRPILPDLRLAGPVFTVNGKVDENADPHETLLAWTGLLSAAKAGHVWVSQPNDRKAAHMGELSAETLFLKGIQGCLVDGFIRDTSFLLKLGFQAWGRGFTPKDIVGYWLPDGVDVPITIGNVLINPGDYICADIDGAIIIPSQHVEEVVTKSEEAIHTENKVRSEIMKGSDPQEAYLKYGKF